MLTSTSTGSTLKPLCTRRSTWTGTYLEDYDGSQGIMGMRHYEKRADVGGDVRSGAYTSAVLAESYVQVYSMGVGKSCFFVSGCDVFA